MKKNTNRKQYGKRTVKVCSFFLAVILSLFLLNDLFLRRIDHNSLRVDGYYLEDKDSLDVVMLGASDVYTCFSSGRAYQDYGFTSYPFATQSITASGTITALKEVVRTQSPELIMVEINAFLYGTDNNESIEAHMRKLVDNIPLTKNKIEFISKNVKPDEQPEYYFPLIKYHSIWKEYPYQLKMVSARLRERNRGTSLFKGYRTTATMFRPKDKVLNDKIIDDNKTKALTPSLENKLREMLDYCKSENLNVVFMRNPHLVYKRTYDRVRRCNRAAEIINSKIAIPCTACSYCTDGCPMNIPIPQFFSIYNEDMLEHLEEKRWTINFTNYGIIAKNRGKASECIGCGQCESVCPQHLTIIDHLKDVAKHYERHS